MTVNGASGVASSRGHRADIDGLRAVAVVPVLLFHAGFGAFSGGFVGVDVFFVISGFLITGIIADERTRGSFSLVRFYERRARRILPALFVVSLACVPFALWLMVPEELTSFGQSLVSVVLFVSNVFFWRASGYFDLAAAEKPLLHTWSLGVEEQFYVLFPMFLVVLWRLGRRRVVVVIAGLAVVSLIASEVLLQRDTLASFYLLPTRAWELFAGSCIAIAGANGQGHERLPPAVRTAIGCVALAMIVAPIFFYGASTPFPGFAALPPVIGTSLLLALPQDGTVVGRILTLPPLLGVGAISYSAYLWHQPLFAFARLVSFDEPSGLVFAGLIAAALAMAALSWRFVEQPFRVHRRYGRRAIFTGAVAGSMALGAIGTALVATHGVPGRFTPATLAFVDPPKTAINGCPVADAWLRVCRLGASGVAPSVALIGDSHAYALGSELDNALRRQGRAGILVHTDCHPIGGVFDSRVPATLARINYCRAADRRLIDRVTCPGIEGVIVAVRWTARLFPLDRSVSAPTFDNGEGGVEAAAFRSNLTIDSDGRPTAAASAKASATANYIEAIAAHTPVALVYPVPEAGWTPTRLNAVAIARGRGPLPAISTSWPRFLARNAAVTAILDGVRSSKVRRVYPEHILCNTMIAGRCVVQANGTLFYFDDNHLASAGARPLVAAALQSLGM